MADELENLGGDVGEATLGSAEANTRNNTEPAPSSSELVEIGGEGEAREPNETGLTAGETIVSGMNAPETSNPAQPEMQGSEVNIGEVQVPSYEEPETSEAEINRREREIKLRKQEAETAKTEAGTPYIGRKELATAREKEAQAEIAKFKKEDLERERLKKEKATAEEEEYGRQPQHQYLQGVGKKLGIEELSETKGEQLKRGRRYYDRLVLANKIKQQENILRQQKLQHKAQDALQTQRNLAILRQQFATAGQVFRSAPEVQAISQIPSESQEQFEPFAGFLAPTTEPFQTGRAHSQHEDDLAFLGGAMVYQHPYGERKQYSVATPEPQVREPELEVPPVKIEIPEEKEEKEAKAKVEKEKKERVRHGHRGRPRARGRPKLSAQKAREKYQEQARAR